MLFAARKQETKNTSTFTALKNPVYRRLWLASLLSGTCVAAQDTAATWVMNTVSNSTLFLSLMSTVASLPFFLFTLPAGAFADMVDRRKLLCVMNVWLAACALGLALLGAFHLLNPYLILTFVFLIGVGFAFNAPAWTSIVPEIVTDEELPSAATLGGLQLNISGIIGPALGGLLLPFLGPNWLFAVNGVCFALVIAAVLQWKRQKAASKLPLENFTESFLTAVRYVRYTPGIQIVLARNVLFAFFISLIPALMPVLGLKVLHLPASGLGLLFTSMGAGSVFGAIYIVPWVRARFSSDGLTLVANMLVAIVYLLLALVQNHAGFMAVAALAGVGWTLSASELWVASQRATPGWARGRINASVIMASQGAMALGGLVWGCSAAAFGARPTLFGASALLLVSLILALPLSINFTRALDFEPGRVPGSAHHLIHVPAPHDGPVVVAYEIAIDRRNGPAFFHLLKDLRLIHLRNGAFSWHLDEDLSRPHVYRIEVKVPSWTEYILQNERLTKGEREVLERVEALHISPNPIEPRVYLSVNRELHGHRHMVSHPGTFPTSPLDLGTSEVTPVEEHPPA